MSTTATSRTDLGADLSSLIDAVGVPVTDVVEVTSIPPVGARWASFRVTFADGAVLKARRLGEPADVLRVTRLLPLLDPEVFPPVLAHAGCALVTRWIPGLSMEGSAWTSGQLRECGRVHGALHRLRVPADLQHLRRRPPDWQGRLEQLLRDLVDRQALDTGRARDTEQLLVAAAPPTQSTSVCHTDFCGDNIIVTDAGNVCVVDNEGLSIDAPEYDLARTWYRWPMAPSQQRAYGEGYGAHEHVARFVAHFLHWALMVVVESAAFRSRVGAGSARVPLERLTHLLHTRGRRESFHRLLRRR